jgi:hypothetical protein
MAKHGSNWMICVHIVNHEINQRAQWNRDNLSPYNMMYGKKGAQRNNVVFGEAAVTHAKTEYGVMCANFFCLQAKKWAPMRLVTENKLQHVMEKGTLLTVSFEIVFIINTKNIVASDYLYTGDALYD